MTFEEKDGKTRLVMHELHPSKEARSMPPAPEPQTPRWRRSRSSTICSSEWSEVELPDPEVSNLLLATSEREALRQRRQLLVGGGITQRLGIDIRRWAPITRSNHHIADD